jgi:hypothetical protein
MIVNLQNEGWEIIYHRAHALLAAQLAGHWDRDRSPQRLYETIAAISHHDDLEKEWEGNELTSAGAPLDFMLEQETHLQLYRQHIEASLYRGRWVALLTSMHLSFLSEPQRDEIQGMKEFLDEQQALQTEWCEALGVSPEQAQSAYNFMRWCDRLSLILCQRQIPAAGRKLEVTPGPDGEAYYIFQQDSDCLSLSPWAFEEDVVEVEVEASYLSQLKYSSNQELTLALKEAPRQQLTWKFRSPAACAKAE